jgi:hypothetical protein
MFPIFHFVSYYIQIQENKYLNIRRLRLIVVHPIAMASAALNMIERAHQMYREGRYSEALGFYTEALAMAKTNPQKIALHSNRAACFLKLHDFNKVLPLLFLMYVRIHVCLYLCMYACMCGCVRVDNKEGASFLYEFASDLIK